MSISITPVSPTIAAHAVADPVLKPGTVIEARVLQLLAGDQVRIAIGMATMEVQSNVALQPGQLLKLAVSQMADGLRLAIVNTPLQDSLTLAPELSAGKTVPALVPLKNQLTMLESAAVATAAQTAATKQTSLAPLFANLGVAAELDGLPPKLQQAIAQVLAQRASVDGQFRGSDLKAAFQSSGLFMEATLAAQAPLPSAAPDMKAALLVLRQVLATTLGSATPQAVQATSPSIQPFPPNGAAMPQQSVAPSAATPMPAQTSATMQMINDITGTGELRRHAAPLAKGEAAAHQTLLNIVLTGQHNTGQSRIDAGTAALLGLVPAVAGQRKGATADDLLLAQTTMPPPPIKGAQPSAQPIAPPTLVPDMPREAALSQLLSDTEGAVARQTLLQVASLPDRIDPGTPRLDATPRWLFEIPFAMPNGTAIAQFEIARDGGGVEADSNGRVWRARFSLDVEPAGPVHALVSLNGDKTSVRLRAERPATAAQLLEAAPQLSDALRNADLKPGDIAVRSGAPPASAPAAAGHFLDRAL
jgi:hypothetical protein